MNVRMPSSPSQSGWHRVPPAVDARTLVDNISNNDTLLASACHSSHEASIRTCAGAHVAPREKTIFRDATRAVTSVDISEFLDGDASER